MMYFFHSTRLPPALSMKSHPSMRVLLVLLSTLLLSTAFTLPPPSSKLSHLGSTTEKPKPGSDVNLGWNTHQAVDSVPDSLVKAGDISISGNDSMRAKFEQMCREAQVSITKAIEEVDGEATFKQDAWTRPTGGGGISRVLSNGKVFEKAGVNLSVV